MAVDDYSPKEALETMYRITRDATRARDRHQMDDTTSLPADIFDMARLVKPLDAAMRRGDTVV